MTMCNIVSGMHIRLYGFPYLTKGKSYRVKWTHYLGQSRCLPLRTQQVLHRKVVRLLLKTFAASSHMSIPVCPGCRHQTPVIILTTIGEHSVLPQQPWNQPAGYYTGTDGSTVYINGMQKQQDQTAASNASWSNTYLAKEYDCKQASRK